MSDIVQCMKRSGLNRAHLCSKCDGKCPACDSYVNQAKEARVCDDCSFGTLSERCILCGMKPRVGDSLVPAFYCKQCVSLERDRDGCPRVLNVHTYKDNSKQL